MTVGQWRQLARRRLEDAGIESPSLEAQMLASHVLLVDRAFVLTHPELDFPELAGESLLQRREAQEPLAYILGYREFYGRRFRVGPGVLVPRQETETLVEAAIQTIDEGDAATVLDLGTGSGCIGITIKLERPATRVTAVDISEKAIGTAVSNAQDLGADVEFVLSDAFAELQERRFDLVVSNPPYIGIHEALPPEVRDFEPDIALFAGHSGLEFYEMLAQSAAAFLSEGGALLMEVGYRQAREVTSIFEALGWTLVKVQQDLSGTDRVVIVQPVYA